MIRKGSAIGVWMTGLVLSVFAFSAQPVWAKELKMPRENAVLTYAPEVPPPLARRRPAIVEVHLDSGVNVMELSTGVKYTFWTFNGHVPGPFIRARQGDLLEVHATNSDQSGMPHNIDFHAVTGPEGEPGC